MRFGIIVCIIMITSAIPADLFALSLQTQNVLIGIVDMFEQKGKNQTEKMTQLLLLQNLLKSAEKRVSSSKLEYIYFMEGETEKRIQLYNPNAQLSTNLAYKSIRDKRESLHNSVRNTPIQQDIRLNQSAQIWAENLAQNQIKAGYTHKRSSRDNYYDYEKIQDWFHNLGIGFIDNNGRTFSESISYNTVKCKSTDCAQELYTATDKSRDFLFTSEKEKNGSHYRAIVEPNFKYLGIGIALTPDKKWYYIVIHYATQVIDI